MLPIVIYSEEARLALVPKLDPVSLICSNNDLDYAFLVPQIDAAVDLVRKQERYRLDAAGLDGDEFLFRKSGSAANRVDCWTEKCLD